MGENVEGPATALPAARPAVEAHAADDRETGRSRHTALVWPPGLSLRRRPDMKVAIGAEPTTPAVRRRAT